MLAFNRGRFNRPRSKSVFFSGRASLELTAAGNLNAVNAFSGAAGLALLTESGVLNTVSNFTGAASLEVFASGVMNTTSLLEGNADISLISSGNVIRVRHSGEIFDGTRNAKFNRMGFNRGKFNASAHRRSNALMTMQAAGDMIAVRGFTGEAMIVLDTESGALNTVSTFEGNADIELSASGRMNATRTLQGAADIIMSAFGRMNMIHALDGAAFMVLSTTSKEFNTFRLEYIELPNLTLAAGDELIIDTDRKTITLNGVNIMRHLSRYSEFFNFNPRENEIEYISSNPNDRVEIRILWKDAWL